MKSENTNVCGKMGGNESEKTSIPKHIIVQTTPRHNDERRHSMKSADVDETTDPTKKVMGTAQFSPKLQQVDTEVHPYLQKSLRPDTKYGLAQLGS